MKSPDRIIESKDHLRGILQGHHDQGSLAETHLRAEHLDRIGAELEGCAVSIEPATYGQIFTRGQELFERMEALGWLAKRDQGTRKIVEVTHPENRHLKVEYDFGVGQIEFGFTPTSSRKNMMQEITRTVTYVDGLMNELGGALIGVGVHPKCFPTDAHVAPKQRYELFMQIFKKNEALQQPSQDVYLMALGTCFQPHITLKAFDEDTATQISSDLCTLAPWFYRMTGNASVYASELQQNSHIGQQLAVRGLFWNIMHQSEGNHRVGIHPNMSTLSSWLNWMVQHRPFLAIRDEELYRVFNVDSFDAWLSDTHVQKTAYGIDVQGERRNLGRATYQDFETLMGSVWPDARSTQYDTVEGRAFCAPQDFEYAEATMALMDGLVANHTAMRKFAKRYTYKEICMAREGAIQRGPLAQIKNRKTGIYEPLNEGALLLVDIAQEGCRRLGESEGILDIFRDDLLAGESPATRALALATREGVDALIQSRRYVPASAYPGRAA